MKNRLALLFITLLTVGNSYSQNRDSKALSIHEPRVEYHENPEGFDVLQPRFSWILKGEGRNRAQSVYQITVASSMEKLLQEQADIWDSGKVISNRTNQIVYEGIPLVSAAKYYWKVRVWDIFF